MDYIQKSSRKLDTQIYFSSLLGFYFLLVATLQHKNTLGLIFEPSCSLRIGQNWIKLFLIHIQLIWYINILVTNNILVTDNIIQSLKNILESRLPMSMQHFCIKNVAICYAEDRGFCSSQTLFARDLDNPPFLKSLDYHKLTF